MQACTSKMLFKAGEQVRSCFAICFEFCLMPQVQNDSPLVCKGFQITFEHKGPGGGTDKLSSPWGLGVRNQAADPISATRFAQGQHHPTVFGHFC